MQSLIKNGIPWYDQNADTVNAHGACIVKDNGRYYLFGEYKTDDQNCFIGFSCYSSSDLGKWTFEKIVLPLQEEGLLGPNRIGERVKVIRSSETGKYIMFMHTDNLQYTDPQIGVAISDTIDGVYQFIGPLLLEGKPLRKWDMGIFIDEDETPYLLTHEGNIYQLTSDCLTIENEIALNLAPGGESPAMFVEEGIYFFLLSNKTSWERNDNYYLTASNLKGPWVHRGNFCPENSLTYNSQCSFVFTNKENKIVKHLYMGDRWSFPKQASSATQVWLPLSVEGMKLNIPEYLESWDYHTGREISLKNEESLMFRSKFENEKCSFVFEGTQVALFGITNRHSGYAQIRLFKNSEILHQSVIDFYSLNEQHGLRYLSPLLEKATYTLEILNLGEFPCWSDKRVSHYGSDGKEITVTGYQFFL